MPVPPAVPNRLLIGPANFAGQGDLWARAIEAQAPDTSVTSYAWTNGVLDFPADYQIPLATYGDKQWQTEFYEHVLANYTHALIEANRPLFGVLHANDGSGDLLKLLAKGLRVGLMAHGSDVRIPSRHVVSEQWSPFPYMEDRTVELLEANTTRSVKLFNSYPGPTYASTPDLLDFVPNATWCPVVIEPERWRSDTPVLERKRPVVAHAPSKAAMKGSDLVDPIMAELDRRGLIEYRRVEGVGPDQMPSVYRDADIVVDQFRIGSYGVAACEAMAAGRLVVSHVSQSVRDHVTAATGLELPIVQATGDDLEAVLLDVIANPERSREYAARGPAFVAEVHDGRRSGRLLAGLVEGPPDVLADWQPPPKRKIVMMADNSIIGDSRVLKYAQTAAKWDLDVTCIGVSSSQFSRVYGSVHVFCPQVPSRASLTGWRKRLDGLRPWFSDEDEYEVAKGRWQYATRELRGDRGRDVRGPGGSGSESAGSSKSLGSRLQRAARWRALILQRAVLEARAFPARRADRATDLGIGKRRERMIALHRSLPSGRWRRQMPEVIDHELTLGPLLDQLEPELIHVHDVFMLGIAARATHRAALAGRKIKLIYDAHEYIPGTPVVPPLQVAAYSDLEREFLPDADRVITISEPLAHWLQRDHKLRVLPDVVLNAPIERLPDAEADDLRDVLSLAADVPLLVYSGGVDRARGIATVVDSLPQLPGVHLAIVANPNKVIAELKARATELGVADRVHLAPFVRSDEVPRYIRRATIGISPMLHAPNHDIAVTNKFCEYLAADLPIITSDTPAQAELVTSLDLGAVYPAGNVDAFVAATRTVLADRDRISERIANDPKLKRRFSWSAQAEVIRSIYEDVLGNLPADAWESDATTIHKILPSKNERPPSRWSTYRRLSHKP